MPLSVRVEVAEADIMHSETSTLNRVPYIMVLLIPLASRQLLRAVAFWNSSCSHRRPNVESEDGHDTGIKLSDKDEHRLL